jgi:hypothetical protein
MNINNAQKKKVILGNGKIIMKFLIYLYLFCIYSGHDTILTSIDVKKKIYQRARYRIRQFRDI